MINAKVCVIMSLSKYAGEWLNGENEKRERHPAPVEG